MDYLLLFISAWIVLVLLMSFVNIKAGVSLFLVYMICVPVVMISIGGKVWGANVINTVFLLAFAIYAYQKHIKIDWSPILPFIAYFMMMLIAMPFQNGMPIANMFDMWRREAMLYLFLPFVMWNVMKADITAVKMFQRALIVGIVIAVAYGLFLTTQDGVNPYQMLLLLVTGDNGEIDWASYYGAFGSGRLFGRISSVFQHPMQFALFLGFAMIYIFAIRKNFSKKFFLIMMTSISVMVLVCGVRSVIGALAIALVYYCVMGKSVKIVASIILFCVVMGIIVTQIPALSSYVGSIVDINNTSGAVSGGSSIDMRMNQLGGAVEEIKENAFWGLGYGWTNYYQSLYGNHPICYAFESLIFVIICNSGIYGFIVWIMLGLLVARNNSKIKNHEKVLVDDLFIYYVAYSCITGEYGYMKMFIIFYVMMLGSMLKEQQEELEDEPGKDVENK